MKSEQAQNLIYELACRFYTMRTGDENPTPEKVHPLDQNRAIEAFEFFESKKQWEYGTIFSVDGEDSRSFPMWWTTSLKEVKEDYDWHSGKTGFPDRKWRIIKRLAPTGVEELTDEEKKEIGL